MMESVLTSQVSGVESMARKLRYGRLGGSTWPFPLAIPFSPIGIKQVLVAAVALAEKFRDEDADPAQPVTVCSMARACLGAAEDALGRWRECVRRDAWCTPSKRRRPGMMTIAAQRRQLQDVLDTAINPPRTGRLTPVERVIAVLVLAKLVLDKTRWTQLTAGEGLEAVVAIHGFRDEMHERFGRKPRVVQSTSHRHPIADPRTEAPRQE